MGLAAGEGVERLAKAEITEADVDEWLEELAGFGEEVLFFFCGCLRRDVATECLCPLDEFCNGEVENVGDVVVAVFVFEGGEVIALSFAFGAGEVEVGEELHFDFFEAVAETAFAATSAGVEGEEARLEAGGFGIGGEGEELSDGFEGSEVDGGGRLGGFGEGSLVDELDGVDAAFGELEAMDGGRFFGGLLAEFFAEIEVESVVGEGGLSAARNSGEAGEEVEREGEIEVAEIVFINALEGEVFFRFSFPRPSTPFPLNSTD